MKPSQGMRPDPAMPKIPCTRPAVEEPGHIWSCPYPEGEEKQPSILLQEIRLMVLWALANRIHWSTMRSHIPVTNFILLGLTADPNLHAAIPLYMSVTYVLSITGNLTIVTFTMMDFRLHTPIFLAPIVTRDRTISYNCFATQLFLFILLGATEFFLLAILSSDRYVTICRSLNYTTLMSPRVSIPLVLCSCLTGFMVIFSLVIFGLQLYFCGSVTTDHFFCDISPLFLLSCSDTSFLQLKALRRKVFSTCSSHIVVISIIYGSCIFMYTKPSAKERVELTKGVAVVNTSLAPMLNPFIYTLWNIPPIPPGGGEF
ncbi:olfactory receptor 6C74-like [Tachyglossus aculeatus]|uniref:olfactory receptor 6C74-like n=1 Tax=Tachyglossus aculeatus TaxID=9261 RepID=UPI0018F2D48A|nr:olfactory receptor 6C74-like [Tachyglossus aculeatus]